MDQMRLFLKHLILGNVCWNIVYSKVLYSREREDIVEKLPRKQSYDFDSNRPRKSSGINPSSVSKMENPMYGLDSSDGKLYSSKVRRWSTNEEGRFTQDSDRLFREIVMSSLKKESYKPDNCISPGIFNQEDKEEGSKYKLPL